MVSPNQNDDPRIDSKWDNSLSATAKGINPDTDSTSILTLFIALIPVLVYVGASLAIFLLLRRKCQRVYAPRTFLSTLHPYERSAPLPNTWFSWLKAFWKVPDTYILNHSSLDGFLSLRFLRVLRNICVVGCCLTWPILLPLHICGGGDGQQLDRLTFGNVKHPSWFFAHCFVSWMFFAFVLHTIYRECIYAINLRQAYLLSPFFANRLSSRTVLLTCLPEQLSDEAKLRKIIGDSVKNVWIPKISWELERLIRERDQTASRLQDAELELVNKANIAWRKMAQIGHSDIGLLDVDLEHGPVEQQLRNMTTATTVRTESTDEKVNWPGGVDSVNFGPEGPPFDVPGSIAAQWIPEETRPVHRPLANFGRRVDTIRWTRKRLKKLGKEIAKVRKRVNRGDVGRSLPAAFIEFTSQEEAQIAYQSLACHRSFHMSRRYIGVRPYEVVWMSLRMRWRVRIASRFGILTVIALMTLFWSIPIAFIGTSSDIRYLAETIPFLGWIRKLPQTNTGSLTGLLPAFALSQLMAIVPGILRVLARVSGVPSHSLIEMFTQRAYFGFQVLQVFLLTTFASLVPTSISNAIKEPFPTQELLAKNVSKASNLHLSHMIICCLGDGAGQLIQLSGLIEYLIVWHFTRNPKIMYSRWHKLRRVHWGGTLPVFINLGAIVLTYSLIAPLILAFAAVGCSFMHVVYKYNLLYVFASEHDTRGLSYILAMKQLLTGLYLAEVCLLGLFALKLAIGPVVMMFVGITATVVFHISLDEAVGPLLDELPRTLSGEKASDMLYGDHNFSEPGHTFPDIDNLSLETPGLENPHPVIHIGNGPRTNGTTPRNKDSSGTDSQTGSRSDTKKYDSDTSSSSSTKNLSRNDRAIEGAEGLIVTAFDLLKMLARVHISPDSIPTDPTQDEPQQPHPKPSTTEMTARDALAAATKATTAVSTIISRPSPPPKEPPLTFGESLKHKFLGFLHPEIYNDFPHLQALIPQDVPDVSSAYDKFKDPYASPTMISGAPRVWIPDDGAAAGCGRQEVAHSGAVTGVVGKGARIDTTGRMEVDLNGEWDRLAGENEGNGGGNVWLRDPDLDWGRSRWW